ncbi:MAG: hypothetical protein IJC39_00090, partial [Firmicutes bacterium]|nr:hypothetical protein [Bacillota bacterium]
MKRIRALTFRLLGILFALGLFLTLGGIPDEILIFAGQERTLEFAMPFSAEISDQSIRVTANKNALGSPEINGGITLLSETPGESELELSLFGMPVKTVRVLSVAQRKVIPCGEVVGVRILSDGVMVLGTGDVDGEGSPAEGIIEAGDEIISINGAAAEFKEDIIDAMDEYSEGTIEIGLRRGKNEFVVDIKPALSVTGKPKLGLWLRDSTQGLGTLTYYDPESLIFGSLGHGIYDVDTDKLVPLLEGDLTGAELNGVKRGEAGEPGELLGNVLRKNVLGEINVNSEYGLFGKLNSEGEKHFSALNLEPLEIAFKHEIKKGTAYLRSAVPTGEPEDY